MPAVHEQRSEAHLPQQETAVYCCLCNPPQRVEVPARVFYRLKDADAITCPNGHQGTLLEYKQAAAESGSAHGPFVRYALAPGAWFSRNSEPR